MLDFQNWCIMVRGNYLATKKQQNDTQPVGFRAKMIDFLDFNDFVHDIPILLVEHRCAGLILTSTMYYNGLLVHWTLR